VRSLAVIASVIAIRWPSDIAVRGCVIFITITPVSGVAGH